MPLGWMTFRVVLVKTQLTTTDYYFKEKNIATLYFFAYLTSQNLFLLIDNWVFLSGHTFQRLAKINMKDRKVSPNIIFDYIALVFVEENNRLANLFMMVTFYTTSYNM